VKSGATIKRFKIGCPSGALYTSSRFRSQSFAGALLARERLQPWAKLIHLFLAEIAMQDRGKDFKSEQASLILKAENYAK
jgi:hypothetical protein